MREVTSIVDDVHRWHDQGGWSQARYQRGIVKETRDHIKHAADELFERFKRGAVQRLIIGTPDELRGEIEAQLHSYLRDRIVGWIDIDIRSIPDRVAKEAASIIERDEEQREREWLDRLQSELGRNARAVSGLEPHDECAEREAGRDRPASERLSRRRARTSSRRAGTARRGARRATT